jgi:2-polyprenyl-6-hydroxyphenyl methylase / 3-demethylubiquinone-9 3-methyltransferase
VLDIGCGGGILSESLAKKGALVTGIDASPQIIEMAKAHAKESELSIHYELCTAEEYAEKNAGTFDSVTCMELLEHVPDPELLIQAASTCLKPKGSIFFSTLNRNIKSYLFAILGAEYLLRLLPKHTHDYEKFIRPSELFNWCKKAGLTPQEFNGINYNPLTKKAHLSKDISVNYLLYAVKKP